MWCCSKWQLSISRDGTFLVLHLTVVSDMIPFYLLCVCVFRETKQGWATWSDQTADTTNATFEPNALAAFDETSCNVCAVNVSWMIDHCSIVKENQLLHLWRYTVILQIFSVVLFLVFSVVKGFTEIKKTPECEKHIERSRQHPRTPKFKRNRKLRDRLLPKF